MADDSDVPGNPYNWRTRAPQRPIPHPLRDEIATGLCNGELFEVVGGHGMGKTVLLSQVAHACDESGACFHVFPGKPAGGRNAYTEALAEALTEGGTFSERLSISTVPVQSESSWPVHEVITKWFEKPENGVLVLLFDEIDRYVEAESTAARDFLDALASVNSEFPDRLGVAVAGGLGVYRLSASQVGSNFSSRAVKKHLAPFTSENIAELARPFADASRPLSDEVLDMLRILSGGIPALVVYGLQHLWTADEPGIAATEDIFARFRDEHEEFEKAVHRGLGIEQQNDSHVYRLWRQLATIAGSHSRRALRRSAKCSVHQVDEGLRLLQASGLIRIHGSWRADPVVTEPVQSILGPEDGEEHPLRADPVEQLRDDLRRQLRRLALVGQDFFQSKREDELVPESVFSAVLALGLQEAGWEAEREPLQGAGFVDLKLRHPRFPDAPDAVVEVKLWPRNDYKDAHEQVTGYAVDGEPERQRAAVVMIAKLRDAASWPDEYQTTCLAGLDIQPHDVEPPLTAELIARQDEASVPVTHFLLNVPRRPRRR